MKFRKFKKVLSMLLTFVLVLPMLSDSAVEATTYNVNLSGNVTSHTSSVFYPIGDDQVIFNLTGSGETYRVRILNTDTGAVLHDVTTSGTYNFTYTFTRGHDAFISISRVTATSVTGTWRFNNRTITRNARLVHDASAAAERPPSSLFGEYSSAAWAAGGIHDRFGVRFSPTGQSTQNAQLNGSHTSTGGTCPRENNLVCNAGCHSSNNLSRCNGNHHKSATRLLGRPAGNTNYTMRFVGHRLCAWESGRLEGVLGVSDFRGRDALSSIFSPNFRSTIQHELGHNIGANPNGTGGHCNTITPNVLCVMKTFDHARRAINNWCTSCTDAIVARKRNNQI